MPTFGFGAAFSLAKKAVGVRFDPYLAYNFLVEIEGIIAGGFTDVSGLIIETQVERKKFGGENNKDYVFANGSKYSDLTFKHGISDLSLLWEWYENVINGTIERKNGSIFVLDHAGLPAMWWDFYEAYPIKWEGPTFNAQTNTVATETLILTHNGLKKPEASKVLSAIRGAASAGGLL